jgi:ankyrin repeat protein
MSRPYNNKIDPPRSHNDEKDTPPIRMNQDLFKRIVKNSYGLQGNLDNQLDTLIHKCIFNRPRIKQDDYPTHLQTIRDLIAQGAKPRVDRFIESILFLGYDVFEILINRFNINTTINEENATPLMMSVSISTKGYDLVQALRRKYQRERPRLTAQEIEEKIDANNNRYLTTILNRPGVLLDLQDWHGQTALHRAARLNNEAGPSRVRALLEAGIDPDIEDKEGNHAIDLSANNEIRRIIQEFTNRPQGGRRKKYKSHTRRKHHHRRHRTYRK